MEEKFKENVALIERASKGDEAAAEELFLLNAGLVKSIAARFLGRGTDFEDLVQLGNLGLLKAMRTFDATRGFAFSTYAVPLIFGEIRRFLRDDGPIKVSRVQKKLGAMLTAEKERLSAEGIEDVPLSVVAERVGVTPAEAASALDAMCPPRSLTDPLGAEESGGTLESLLSDEDEPERTFEKMALSAAIDKLPAIRRKIILLRYYRDFSQDQTARALGLSQVKVSREEKKILSFLREELS
ncbi:MAG: sigma-70 family RNA polymerase sigma factor [Clostridia bacterium]|nr:sigma-70 family RNA polymerase sigma factor [Clostridia bacterium]